MPRTNRPPLATIALEVARSLRGASTDAERVHWRRLRAGQLEGLRFRRQHPIPPYTVDFYCHAEHLVIEIDGSQHNDAVDAARSRFLEARGLRVLRFWNNDVLGDTDAVVAAIFDFVAKLPLTPNPSPDGRGALDLTPTPLPMGEGL